MRQILSACKQIWYGIDYYKAYQQFPFEREASFHGFVSETFFSSVGDPTSPTKRKIYTFALKKGKRASLGLEAIKKGISFLDCGSVCFLASFLALSDLLENFDSLFDAEGKFPLILTCDGSGPISHFMPRIILNSESEIRRGDICYFCNCKEYTIKHPAGEARGFYVVCCQENPHLYLGFGLSQGLNRLGIEKSLWKNFNEEPVDEGFYPDHVWKYLFSQSLLCDEKKSHALVQAYKNRTLSWEEYQSLPGRLDPKKFPMDGKMARWVFRVNHKSLEELS